MARIKIGKNDGKGKKRGGFWDGAMTASLLLLLFRIPLANIIGNEGNGYLAISWEVCLLISMFCGYGFYVVMGDMVRKRARKNLYHNSVRVLTCGLLTGLLLSVLGGLGIYFFSDALFEKVFFIRAGTIGFKVFSLFLVVSTVNGCIRGYFEGIGTKVPTRYSKIIEALIAGVEALVFASYFMKYGKKTANLLLLPSYEAGFGAAGVVLGLLCGAVISMIFLIIVHRMYQSHFHELLRKDETRTFESYQSIIKEIFSGLFIVVAPVFFFKVYRLVNMVLYLNSFEQAQKINSLKTIGSYYGRVLLLLFLGITLILGICGHNAAKIKKAYSLQKIKLVKKYYVEDIRKFLIFSVPTAILLCVGGEFLLKLFFDSVQKNEIRMLQIGSIYLVLLPLATYGYYILSYWNKNAQILVIFTLSFVLQTLGMAFLVRSSLASFSMVVAEIIFWVSTLLLQSLYFIKTMDFSVRMNKS